MNAVTDETVVCQVLVNGQWLDWARGTLEQVQQKVRSSRPGEFRGVDWLDKHRVVVPPHDPKAEIRERENLLIGQCMAPPCPHCGTQVYNDMALRMAAEGRLVLDTTPTHLCR